MPEICHNHLTLSRGGVRISHSPDNTLSISAAATGEEGHARSESVVDGLLQEVEPSHAASIHVHKLPRRVTINTINSWGTRAQGDNGTARKRGNHD